MPASLVAIVTRTKNRPLLLERALNSVLGQSFADWHQIVVNDGGDPAPVDALAERYRELVDDGPDELWASFGLGLADEGQPVARATLLHCGGADEAERDLAEVLDGSPTVLVLGSEGEGLRRLVAEHCDALARIAMPGGFESLNVSAAAAIALYEAGKPRG